MANAQKSREKRPAHNEPPELRVAGKPRPNSKSENSLVVAEDLVGDLAVEHLGVVGQLTVVVAARERLPLQQRHFAFPAPDVAAHSSGALVPNGGRGRSPRGGGGAVGAGGARRGARGGGRRRTSTGRDAPDARHPRKQRALHSA